MNGYQKMGDLLVAEGLITNLQLSTVLTAQRTSKRRLGDLLVERGFATETQIAECLAKQYSYPLTDLSAVSPDANALGLLDPEVALSYCVLPVAADDQTLQCVIADPVDIVGTDFISQMVRRRLTISIAPKSKLLDAINAAYSGSTSLSGEGATDVPFPPKRYADARARKRMGNVAMFDAFDAELGRQVTLSAARIGSDEEREHTSLVKALARTTAKAICAVHDSFDQNGYRYFVFEALDGEPLSQVLAHRGPRSLMQAAEMVAEIGEGIDALSRMGGRVGAVCPENVMIRWNGPLLVPFVSPGPEYSCPEGNGSEGTAACDTYALGTLLWESINASNPHIATQVASGGAEQWADPRKAKNMPTALRDILNNCLGMDPRERYATAFQLSNALRSYNWAAASLTVMEGGASISVPHSRDREQLLELITNQEEDAKQPFWKRWFGRKKAA